MNGTPFYGDEWKNGTNFLGEGEDDFKTLFLDNEGMNGTPFPFLSLQSVELSH
jgi:hypothetical protein